MFYCTCKIHHRQRSIKCEKDPGCYFITKIDPQFPAWFETRRYCTKLRQTLHKSEYRYKKKFTLFLGCCQNIKSKSLQLCAAVPLAHPTGCCAVSVGCINYKLIKFLPHSCSVGAENKEQFHTPDNNITIILLIECIVDVSLPFSLSAVLTDLDVQHLRHKKLFVHAVIYSSTVLAVNQQ